MYNSRQLCSYLKGEDGKAFLVWFVGAVQDPYLMALESTNKADKVIPI